MDRLILISVNLIFFFAVLLLSADEMLFEPNLTKKQTTWIERFIVVWDYTTNLDVQMNKLSRIIASQRKD